MNRTTILPCLADRHCPNVDNSCHSTACICNHYSFIYPKDDRRSIIFTLPIVAAMQYDLSSSRSIYIFIVLSLVLIGLINNLFLLTTSLRPLIRLTVSGIYFFILSISSLLLMALLLTNLIAAHEDDNYFSHLWTCFSYPYLYWILVNIGILMTACIALENVLIKCFSFHQFRSRRYAIIVSLALLFVLVIANLDKIFTRQLRSDDSHQWYCTYKYDVYPWWSYTNASSSYLYIFVSAAIHGFCIICTLTEIIRRKQRYHRKLFYYHDILLPSLIILSCLLSYLLYHYRFTSCRMMSNHLVIRLHLIFSAILCLPHIFSFVLYIRSNGYYFSEFRQASLGFFCCCRRNQKHTEKEKELLQQLWQQRDSLETIATISSLIDDFISNDFYKKIRLEV